MDMPNDRAAWTCGRIESGNNFAQTLGIVCVLGAVYGRQREFSRPEIEAPAFWIELQAPGTRPLHLAQSREGRGVAEPRATVNGVGRHRLAETDPHRLAVGCSIRYFLPKMSANVHAADKWM
jgi:hypothetical protein